MQLSVPTGEVSSIGVQFRDSCATYIFKNFNPNRERKKNFRQGFSNIRISNIPEKIEQKRDNHETL